MKNGHNGIVHYKAYVAGWFNSSIHELLEHFPLNSKSMAYALVTSIDSDVAPYIKLQQSESLASDARPLGDGVLLPTARLVEIDPPHRFFFGFDEVWFFPSDDIQSKPESAWIVGPRRIDQTTIDALGDWMAANDCSLALGDGEGLNLIVKAHGLLRHLIANSMFQCQPTVAVEK
jgi:hypothetical protein